VSQADDEDTLQDQYRGIPDNGVSGALGLGVNGDIGLNAIVVDRLLADGELGRSTGDWQTGVSSSASLIGEYACMTDLLPQTPMGDLTSVSGTSAIFSLFFSISNIVDMGIDTENVGCNAFVSTSLHLELNLSSSDPFNVLFRELSPSASDNRASFNSATADTSVESNKVFVSEFIELTSMPDSMQRLCICEHSVTSEHSHLFVELSSMQDSTPSDDTLLN